MADANQVFESLFLLWSNTQESNTKIKVSSQKESTDNYRFSYWFEDHNVNIKHPKLKESSRVWVKFWDSLNQNINISFKDVGGSFKPHATKIFVEQGGVWWFDLPGPLGEYSKLGITIVGESNTILYEVLVS